MFELVSRIILIRKTRSTKRLGYVVSIIHYLKRIRMGGYRGHIWVYIFEAYNLFMVGRLVISVGYD